MTAEIGRLNRFVIRIFPISFIRSTNGRRPHDTPAARISVTLRRPLSWCCSSFPVFISSFDSPSRRPILACCLNPNRTVDTTEGAVFISGFLHFFISSFTRFGCSISHAEGLFWPTLESALFFGRLRQWIFFHVFGPDQNLIRQVNPKIIGHIQCGQTP